MKLTFPVFTSLLWLFPLQGTACSLVGCLDHGIEMNRDFVVAVKHEGKPLKGVTVNSNRCLRCSTFFGRDYFGGPASIVSLPPGTIVDISFLGIGAGYECFHVSERPSRKAKQQVKFEWGDEAPATRRIVGRLIDSQPGTGENPIWNIIHSVNVPITEARLNMQDPITRKIFSTTSDQNGTFAMDGIPAGIYVLHIEGGGGRDYEPTDLLIRISPRASRDALELTRREAEGGSCGGTSLDLVNTPSQAKP